MATPLERARGLLCRLLDSGYSVLIDVDSRAAERGWAEGRDGALGCVGLPLEDAEVGRADLWRAEGPPPLVDAASLERAAGMLSELFEAMGHGEAVEPLACCRFQGALHALTELGAVDPDQWHARLRERLAIAPEEPRDAEDDEACPAGPTYPRIGTEQQLVDVIAGCSELTDGWRVLYGLRFQDGISFTFWRDPGAGPGPRDWDAPDSLTTLDLRDSVGTKYGSGSCWGAEDGAHGVSFSTPPPEDASWVELVDGAGTGRAVRLSL